MGGMKQKPAQTAVAALSVMLTGGASAPSEIRLLPAGRFRAADGSGRPTEVATGWMMDGTIAAALIAQADSRASDYAIDYEHQTLRAELNGQPAPAAGWFKQLEWRDGDGLYAVDVRWTERASAMVASGEYRYLSPVFAYSKVSGAVTRLGPAALTNNPGLDGLTDLSALSALLTEENSNMDKDEILAQLGLPAAASQEDIKAQIAALKSAAPDPAQWVPLAEYTGLQTQLAALSTEVETDKRDLLVETALSDGRILPAQETYWRAQPVAALSAYLDVAQPMAAISGMQSGGTAPLGAGAGDIVALTADQLALCDQMRISPDEFLATLKGQA